MPSTVTSLPTVGYGPACYGTRMVGSVGLIKEGAGTLTLAGNNTYSGGTTITSGTIQGGQNALGLGAGDACAVTVGSPLPVPYIPPYPGQTLVGRDYWGGTGATMITGGLLQLGGVNTYSGGTTVCGGTLQVGTTINLVSPQPISLPAINYYQPPDTSGGSWLGEGSVCLQGGGLLSDGCGIQSGLVVEDGTLTFVDPNIYSGSTAIAAGTPAIANCGTGGTTISGGTLDMSNGICASYGTLTLANSGLVNLATLTSSNNWIQSATLEPIAVFNHDSEFVAIAPSSSTPTSPIVEVGSAAAFADGGSLTVGTGTGVFSVRAPAPTVIQNLSTVPEPGTLALLAIAAGQSSLCAFAPWREIGSSWPGAVSIAFTPLLSQNV